MCLGVVCGGRRGWATLAPTAPCRQHQIACKDREGAQALHFRRYPCSALAGPDLALPDMAPVGLPDRPLHFRERRCRAARIGPNEIANEDEIRAGGGEFARFLG